MLDHPGKCTHILRWLHKATWGCARVGYVLHLSPKQRTCLFYGNLVKLVVCMSCTRAIFYLQDSEMRLLG
jgi:hypothetical protein